jgi:hypothetical protein
MQRKNQMAGAFRDVVGFAFQSPVSLLMPTSPRRSSAWVVALRCLVGHLVGRQETPVAEREKVLEPPLGFDPLQGPNSSSRVLEDDR